MEEEEMDALSHVDSEQGDVPQAELESMRKRIRKGEVDTKRMLQWIADATEAAQQPTRAAERGRAEPGFVGGKRKLQRGGPVPYGRVCPALSARIEVEFEDAVYCGDTLDVKCGQHRFREIQRHEADNIAAGERSDKGRSPGAKASPRTGEAAARCTPPKRKRSGSRGNAGGSAPRSDDSPGAEREIERKREGERENPATGAMGSESAATAESSAPQSSAGFAVSTEEDTGQVQLSQATADLVGGVTNDLNASLAQIGMFLEKDCAEKEGKSN